ncbi:hypothetical protein [Sorangium sp. So ce1099]|uniref:hypothetical protein n=1 Tax=Sorangium sp. So ce1099 TaxID=3133331 RepID=UPI003F5F66C5
MSPVGHRALLERGAVRAPTFDWAERAPAVVVRGPGGTAPHHGHFHGRRLLLPECCEGRRSFTKSSP